MEFVILKDNEFKKFAEKHPCYSFHQTKNWANLKAKNGWDSCFIGLKDNKKVVAAALLLSKNTPLKKKMFYSPRGLLIDYKNKDLLKEFTNNIKKYVKKNNGIFIKIDPYLLYQERDINGDIVENGINNKEAVENLINLGYHHYGFNLNHDKELQPRWVFILNLKDKTEDEVFKNFNNETKRYINRCLKSGLEVEEIGIDKLDEYKKIMEHTATRRGFIDRPMSYYKNMMIELDGHIKILMCYLNTKTLIKSLKEKLSQEENKLKEINQKLAESPNSKKTKVQKKEIDKAIEDTKKKLENAKQLQEQHGDKITLSGSMFLLFGKEVLYLYSGSYDEFMYLNGQYLIQWEIIKYAINNGYEDYNFYGIDGNYKDKNSEMYGVYEFKKGFGGQIVEYIGEFDLIVNKPFYYLYKLAFFTYKTIKNLKNKKGK